MMILPAIDLKEGRCVRLIQGQIESATVYDEDPVKVAKAFAAGGAEMIHVVDLDGALGKSKTLNRKILKAIVDEINVPVQFGGGMRTVADVEEVLALGVTRIVLGTLAQESQETLLLLVEKFRARICVGIDALNGRVKTKGWQHETDLSAVEFARGVASAGVQRIVYTDIARDGMLTGPNIEQTCEVARAANVPITASGGISSLADIERVRDANEPLVDSVIVGKALYEGRFKLEEALQAAMVQTL